MAPIGIILLIGIVKKNGIMMVGFRHRPSASSICRRMMRFDRLVCCDSAPS